MVKPRGRQQKGSASGKKRKQPSKDAFFEADEEQLGFFDNVDEQQRDASESEEEEVEETAEEKRLRLAKEYLGRLKAAREDEEGEAESDRDEEGHDAVADRLRQDALESLGHYQRKLAQRLQLPPLPTVAEYQQQRANSSGGSSSGGGARFLRGHRLSVTAVALSPDDRTCFSVSKDGSILQIDVESGQRQQLLRTSDESDSKAAQRHAGGADWVKQGPRRSNTSALLAAAVSSDGRYLACGGGDKRVHVWDVRSGQYLRGFPGHKDAVTGLAFRDGTQQLFSASLDRSVKIWSVDDMAYVDTLFGHQAEVLGVAAARAERAVTCAADRTCRVWKVPEESQLIFRGHCNTIECCAYLTGSEWVTGAADGSLQLWASTKKKPVYTVRGAHFDPNVEPQPHGGAALGAGSVGGDAATWVGSVAVCKGSDLVASGAGDGAIRLWRVGEGAKGPGSKALLPLGGVPARGFVNGLALARSGRLLVAGLGQEPRLGRWLRDKAARNGVLVQPLQLGEEARD